MANLPGKQTPFRWIVLLRFLTSNRSRAWTILGVTNDAAKSLALKAVLAVRVLLSVPSLIKRTSPQKALSRSAISAAKVSRMRRFFPVDIEECASRVHAAAAFMRIVYHQPAAHSAVRLSCELYSIPQLTLLVHSDHLC